MHHLRTWQLFAICVLIWSTTWYAITFQIGDMSPEAGVALRFAIAGFTVLGWRAVAGDRLIFGLADHARFALQGAFLYGVSYVAVYHAEQHVVSGLVAVGYSASPLVTGLGAHWLFGVKVSRRFVVGGLLGLAGVALIFWQDIVNPSASRDTTLGIMFTVAGVLLAAVGSLTASRNRSAGLPFWPSLGYGMLYGAASAAVIALAQGHSFLPPASATWWLSLLYLALAGSVVTFACFLTLQNRIGPGPTAAVGVMTPLLALVVSMAFEGFRPELLTAVGAACAVLGNVLMLRRAG